MNRLGHLRHAFIELQGASVHLDAVEDVPLLEGEPTRVVDRVNGFVTGCVELLRTVLEEAGRARGGGTVPDPGNGETELEHVEAALEALAKAEHHVARLQAAELLRESASTARIGENGLRRTLEALRDHLRQEGRA